MSAAGPPPPPREADAIDFQAQMQYHEMFVGENLELHHRFYNLWFSATTIPRIKGVMWKNKKGVYERCFNWHVRMRRAPRDTPEEIRVCFELIKAGEDETWDDIRWEWERSDSDN